MRKLLLTIAAIQFFTLINVAQVLLTMPMMSEFAITPSSLIDVQLYSTSGGELVTVESDLKRVGSGEKLMMVATQEILLKKGMNVIRSMSSNLQTNYSSSSLATEIQLYHRLPTGQFEHCVHVRFGGGLEEEINECEILDSQAEMFLNLIFPNNEDSIEVTRPSLNWFHSGVSFGDDLHFFRLTVCEIQDDQTAEEAIRQNQSLFTLQHLQRHSINFPVNIPSLVKGKSYAWNIEYLNQDRVVISSEFWKFHIKNEILIPPVKYVELKKNFEGETYTVVDNRIYFTISDPVRKESLSITVKGSDGTKYKPTIMPDDAEAQGMVSYGQFTLDLRPLQLKEGSYLLEVTSGNGGIYKLKFIVQ